MKKLTISQVAKSANVNIETIKYYEKLGLLAKPERNASGYRQFERSAIEDLLRIKRAQAIGFTLKEIKLILNVIKQDHYFPADEMRMFAVMKIHEINEKIARLNEFKSLLEQATNSAGDTNLHDIQECPVIHKIKGGVDYAQND